MSDQIGALHKLPSSIRAARIAAAGASLSTKQIVRAIGIAHRTAASSIPAPLNRLMMVCVATLFCSLSSPVSANLGYYSFYFDARNFFRARRLNGRTNRSFPGSFTSVKPSASISAFRSDFEPLWNARREIDWPALSL
jgi:hypothetical protein